MQKRCERCWQVLNPEAALQFLHCCRSISESASSLEVCRIQYFEALHVTLPLWKHRLVRQTLLLEPASPGVLPGDNPLNDRGTVKREKKTETDRGNRQTAGDKPEQPLGPLPVPDVGEVHSEEGRDER